MRSARSRLFTALLVLLCPGLFAQTATETAEQWLVDKLNGELSSRAKPLARDKDALFARDYHFVFLVETSHVKTESAYREFAAGLIKRFLNRMLQNQRARGLEHSLVSFYPYQLDLYTDDDSTLESANLEDNTIEETVARMPRVPFPQRPNGQVYPDRGHDNSGARAALIKHLSSQAHPAKPTIIIQITMIALNEDPKDPENDRRIRSVDGRTGLLEDGGDFVAYRVEGLPLKTDRPGVGEPPYDVHVWLYGPPVVEMPSGVINRVWVLLAVVAIVVTICLMIPRCPLRQMLSLPAYSLEFDKALAGERQHVHPSLWPRTHAKIVVRAGADERSREQAGSKANERQNVVELPPKSPFEGQTLARIGVNLFGVSVKATPKYELKTDRRPWQKSVKLRAGKNPVHVRPSAARPSATRSRRMPLQQTSGHQQSTYDIIITLMPQKRGSANPPRKGTR